MLIERKDHVGVQIGVAAKDAERAGGGRGTVNTTFVLGLANLWLLLTLGSSRGDTLVSSLGSETTWVGATGGGWVASPFQTGSQDWNLSSITFNLRANGGPGASLFYASLFSDNNGKPGNILCSLGSQEVGITTSHWTFLAASSFTLESSTKYWAAVGTMKQDQGGDFGVSYADLGNSFSFTSNVGASMEFRASGNVGALPKDGPPTQWQDGSDGVAIVFQVNGAPIQAPEPEARGLLVVGGICALVARKMYSGR